MKEFNHVKFCERLKHARERAGLSQDELATAAKMARPVIGFYENGKRIPQVNRLYTIAQALNVTCSYLIGDQEYWEEHEYAPDDINDLVASHRMLVKLVAEMNDILTKRQCE